jgi:hypothetical protein
MGIGEVAEVERRVWLAAWGGVGHGGIPQLIL